MRAHLLLALGIVLASSCVPVPQPAGTPTPQALPSPRSHTALPPLETTTRPPEPADGLPSPNLPLPGSSPVPTTLQDLARAQFGSRLVEWVNIPRLNLLAPVVPAGWQAGDEGAAWDSPGAKVGWMLSSALPGEEGGNVVLFGHNNINSSVFRNLADLQPGDEIGLKTAAQTWTYRVAEVNIFPARSEAEQRAAAEEYLKPTRAPRLTLLSCWPPTNNTHRVIVVAFPSRGE